MKNMKIVEDVFLETVLIVDVVILIYGALERSNREYNNVNTMLKIEVKPRLLLVMKVGEEYVYISRFRYKNIRRL